MLDFRARVGWHGPGWGWETPRPDSRSCSQAHNSQPRQESNGVIRMIDLLIADLDKEMTEAEVTEKDSQAAIWAQNLFIRVPSRTSFQTAMFVHLCLQMRRIQG